MNTFYRAIERKLKLNEKNLLILIIALLVSQSMVVAAKQNEDISFSDILIGLSAEEIKLLEEKNIEKYEKLQKRERSTKVYNNAISKLDIYYTDIIFTRLIEFEKENPYVSEDEVNDYFMMLCQKYNSNNTLTEVNTKNSTSSVSNAFYNYINGQVQLNANEQALYNSNPSKGFKALMAGLEASDWTVYKFGYNGHNENTDAFRHAAWNIWIIGFTDDYQWAVNWTTAHESGAINQPQIEAHMDLANNATGRLFASNNNIGTNSSPNDTRWTITESYLSGQMVKIINNSLQSFYGSLGDYIN